SRRERVVELVRVLAFPVVSDRLHAHSPTRGYGGTTPKSYVQHRERPIGVPKLSNGLCDHTWSGQQRVQSRHMRVSDRAYVPARAGHRRPFRVRARAGVLVMVGAGVLVFVGAAIRVIVCPRAPRRVGVLATVVRSTNARQTRTPVRDSGRPRGKLFTRETLPDKVRLKNEHAPVFGKVSPVVAIRAHTHAEGRSRSVVPPSAHVRVPIQGSRHLDTSSVSRMALARAAISSSTPSASRSRSIRANSCARSQRRYAGRTIAACGCTARGLTIGT